MSVAKNKKTKKWYAKLYYKDYSGKRWQKKKEGFATRREALAWERDFKARAEGEERLTFGQAYDRYIEDGKRRYKKSTITARREKRGRFTKLEDLVLVDITPSTIRKYQNDVLLAVDETGEQLKYQRSTIIATNRALSAFFAWCEKFCGLKSNPVKQAGAIDINRALEKPKKKGVFWTVEDFERFIETVQRDDYHLMFSILFWCGLRRGELLGLTVEDVDLSNRTLRIRNNLTVGGMDTTKTVESSRMVSLPRAVADELSVYIGRMFKPEKDQLLFMRSPSQLTAVFRQYQKKIDFKPYINLHYLRHSHASMLINMGFTPDVVGDRLGHADGGMVNKTYGHLYKERRIEVVDKIDLLIEKIEEEKKGKLDKKKN